jgi:hypothetical protein
MLLPERGERMVIAQNNARSIMRQPIFAPHDNDASTHRQADCPSRTVNSIKKPAVLQV